MPPYDVRSQEQRPFLAIYSPSFEKAEECVTTVVKDFLAIHDKIQADGYDNEAVARVCDELRKFQTLTKHYKPIGPVACLGPAGVGKSSTINSILSQKMAAPEHDGDERGTYVVHEYLGPLPTQVTPYAVEVPFRDTHTVDALVIRHQNNIIKAQLPEEELDEDVDDDLEQKSDTAIEFFHNLLCNHKDFRTLDDVKSFFEDREDDQQGATEEILHHIQQFLEARNLRNNQEFYECIDERQLNDVFKKVSRPFRTRGNANKTPTPWPLVSKVRVRQDLDLLKSGLVLGDTPGINDTNLTVVENTTNYLKDADSILVFASIKRVSKDTALDQALRDCIVLGKMQSICLVITMIDSKEPFSSYERDGLDQSDLDALEAKEEGIAAVNFQIRDVEALKRMETNNDRFRALDVQLEALARKVLVANAELKQLVVEIHCNAVRASLKDKLKKLTKNNAAPELKVLFISNTQYQKHVSGYDALDLPALDVQATGIPALRQLLYGIPARGKLETMKMIAKHRVPQAIKGISGILNKSTLERKEEVRQEVEQHMYLFDALVPGLVKSILRSFRKQISAEVNKNDEKWTERGEKLAKTWEKNVKPATFGAFCRKGGFWRMPRTKNMISWNGSICDISKPKLGAILESFLYSIDGEIDVCPDKLAEVFFAYKAAIEMSPAAQGMDLSTFFSVIDDIKEELTADLCHHTYQLREICQNVSMTMTTDGKDNYFAEAMQATYDACALFSNETYGKQGGQDRGSHQSKRRRLSKQNSPHTKRLECVRKKLSGSGEESIFVTMCRKAERNLTIRLQDWEKDVQTAIRKSCEKIISDFDERYQDAEEDTEEGTGNEQDPVAIEKLQEAVKVALSSLEGEVMGYFEDCEAYEKLAT